jgi:hypothetical protein
MAQWCVMELNYKTESVKQQVIDTGSQTSVNLFEQAPRPELPKLPSNQNPPSRANSHHTPQN